MLNKLRQNARRIALGATLGLAALAGCSVTPLKNDRLLYGSELGEVSSSKAPYSVPFITHSGLDLVPEIGLGQPKNGELGFVFQGYNSIRDNNVWINIDRKNKTFTFESEDFFVVAPYMIPASGTTPAKPATQVFFKREGTYGLGAKITGIRRVGDHKLGLGNITQENLEYGIPIVGIDTDRNPDTPNEDFYAPSIINKDTKDIEARLLIPVDEAMDSVNPNTGQLKLTTLPGRIFVIKPKNYEDYKKEQLQADTMPPTIPQKEPEATIVEIR